MDIVTPQWREPLSLLPGYDPFAQAEGCWFDPVAAQLALDFFPECIRHVEGAMAGKPFALERWQQAFVANLFGWKRKDVMGRDVRRFREVLLYVPRKNGKTPLAAALALLVLFADDEAGQQNYIAAADREQAGMLFRQCQGMVTQEPELSSRCRIYGGNASAGQSRSIVIEEENSFLRVISADANSKHGGTSHLVLVDELHAQPNRDLVDVLQTSMASANRKQPLLVFITTADFARPSICNEKYEYAKKVRDGIVSDPSFLPVIYEAREPEDDWKDPKTWAKANPNLGVSVSLEYLERECKRAQETPSYENTFKRLHLNIQTEQDVRWMPMERWDACGTTPLDLDALKGRECWGGLDLASTTDLSALVLIFPGTDESFDVLPFFWAPEEAVKVRERSRRTRLDDWVQTGLIETTPGNVCDYAAIRKKANELNRLYQIREIAFDRWNSSHLVIEMHEADGIPMRAFGQGFASMSAPMKILEGLVLGKKIRHGGNPVLRWMVSNVTAKMDPAGNVKPDRAKSTEKIDGLVALVMALGVAADRPPPSVYDTAGLDFV